MDVPGAYLKARMPKDVKSKFVRMRLKNYLAKIYCDISPNERRYLLSNGDIIVELFKALYGCLESGKLWYETLKGLLSSIGFVCNAYDKCIFHKKKGGTLFAVLTVYVVDIMLMTSTENVLDSILNDIKRNLPDVVIHHGRIHNYIGMILNFTITSQVSVSMNQFVNDLLDDFNFD